jgi:hypothetical protein
MTRPRAVSDLCFLGTPSGRLRSARAGSGVGSTTLTPWCRNVPGPYPSNAQAAGGGPAGGREARGDPRPPAASACSSFRSCLQPALATEPGRRRACVPRSFPTKANVDRARGRSNAHEPICVRLRRPRQRPQRPLRLLLDVRCQRHLRLPLGFTHETSRGRTIHQRENGAAAYTTRPPTIVSNTFASLICVIGMANRSRSITTRSASLPTISEPLLASSPSAHALFTV